jgi:hypothetical protein
MKLPELSLSTVHATNITHLCLLVILASLRAGLGSLTREWVFPNENLMVILDPLQRPALTNSTFRSSKSVGNASLISY